MVKRFFEIEVDARGNPKTVNTTNNYKLFKDYNLEICKEVGFFNEHFGKYPVVYIDFKPLDSVDTSEEILDVFKIIVENSLNQHNCILQSSRAEKLLIGITGFNVNDIGMYASNGITKDVDGLNLTKCFKHLCTILNRVFEKKVFVLIDNYDAFLDSAAIKSKTNGEKLMSFIKSSVGQLLNDTNCVDRVLITGVIPVLGEELLSNNIESYHFLDSHPFTKYYGLMCAEVDTVLDKVIESDEERRDVRNTIKYYYSAYETRKGDVCVYNVWSVLQYVCRRTVQSYWCKRRDINKFEKCLKIEAIRQKFEALLLSKELEVNISQPVSISDVSKVNSMIISGKAEHLSSEVELFFVLLFHFGYLSPIDDLDRGVVCVNIPSEEIKYELGKAVFDENRQLYSGPYMNNILSALDAFRPDATDIVQNFDTLRKNVYTLYQNNQFQFTRVLECVFMHFLSRTKYKRVMGRTFEPDGPTAVLLENRREVAFCVTCDVGQTAEVIHQKVTNNDCGKHIFDVFNDVLGKVIIAIGSNGGISYSYYKL